MDVVATPAAAGLGPTTAPARAPPPPCLALTEALAMLLELLGSRLTVDTTAPGAACRDPLPVAAPTEPAKAQVRAHQRAVHRCPARSPARSPARPPPRGTW